MSAHKATQKLHDLGQSLWLDNITRDLLDHDTLQRYIAEFSVTARLQQVGAASFAKSWNKLLAVIEAKGESGNVE